MKPLRIEISNFGAIQQTNINLRDITCAAIAGPNGAGKSTAFTIAPRFALFGAVKSGCSVDDMVRTGSTEAAVTFYFEQHGDVWRVIRTRSTKGKGKSTLELQRQSGELWTSESGASIAETQKKIISLLNLDDETFVSSSMILQGRANEFTSRPAGQRKAILTQILQLEQYEKLQEKARSKAQEVNISLEKCKVKIADIDTRLAAKPSIEGEKLAAEVKLTAVVTSIAQLEQDLQTAQVGYNVLVAKIQQADEIGQQAKKLRDDVSVKTLERDRQQVRLDNANKLLDREAEILAKVADYEATKDTVIALRTKKEQQNNIAAEAQRLKNDLYAVEQSINDIVAKIVLNEDKLSKRSELEVAKSEYDAAIVNLAECQKRKEHDQLLLDAVKACDENLMRAEDKYLNQENVFKQQIKSLEEKTAMLADAGCVDIEHAQCRFLADAVTAKSQLPTTQEEYSKWRTAADAEISNLQIVLKQKKEARAAYGFNPLEPFELQQKIDELKPSVDQLLKLDAIIPLLENLKVQKVDLENRQINLNTQIETKRTEWLQLSEALKQLPELEFKMAQLEPWLKSKEQLPAAREAAKTAQEIITRLNSEIDITSAQADKLQQEYQAMIGDAEGLKTAAESKVRNIQEALKKHRDDHTVLTGQLGWIQAKLDGLAQDESNKQTLVSEMEPLAKELVRWQTLVKAFGRDGIPALIIENAVPELERIANDILAQMTGGKNYLKFETQKELKSRSGMAETLDIIVGDWAGERIYETFSGGEQLRIDFAIRFALAELLARRAGAKVDWLTIDEGFGSQSEEYLPAVIDAVKSVSNRFGLVLVISHVKAVQEAFEQRIEFRPAVEEDAPIEVNVA